MLFFCLPKRFDLRSPSQLQCIAKLPHNPKIAPVVDPSLSLIPPITSKSSYYDGRVFYRLDLDFTDRSSRFCIYSYGSQRFGKLESTPLPSPPHCNNFLQIHNAGFFLPWHRLFVQTFEDALRSKCGYHGVQPYWDWTKGNSSHNKYWILTLIQIRYRGLLSRDDLVRLGL